VRRALPLALALAGLAPLAGADPLDCLPWINQATPEGYSLDPDPSRDSASVETLADDVVLWTRDGGPDRGALAALTTCPGGGLSVILFLPGDRLQDSVARMREMTPGPGSEMGSAYLMFNRQASGLAHASGGHSDRLPDEFGACVCAAAGLQ